MARLTIVAFLGLAVSVLAAGPLPTAQASSGAAAAQTRLVELGYLSPSAVSGRMDGLTRQAVMAFQGWEGLARDGVLGPVTRARLATARRPEVRPARGSRIEIDLRRQVALLVRGARVVRAIHVSTGGVGTPTPTGRFRIYRKERESWSVPFRVWLPWASYFSGGVALHGYPDVPGYPASHGCVRIPLPEAPTVYAFARLGVPVDVVA
jgi:L,D-transpeptidase catalytic domain/Putative peptidoglycan binding domain